MDLKLEGVRIIDCSRVRGGPDSVCALLPSAPGVYAWFRNFSPPDPDLASAQAFYQYLIHEIGKPHTIPRQAQVGPNYMISLKSRRILPIGKSSTLLTLCESLSFRRQIHSLLGRNSLLFSQPLYIGKSDDLRRRAREHLDGRSALIERFLLAGVRIEASVLAYIVVDEATAADHSAELVLEDLLSRIFYPPLTERYG